MYVYVDYSEVTKYFIASHVVITHSISAFWIMQLSLQSSITICERTPVSVLHLLNAGSGTSWENVCFLLCHFEAVGRFAGKVSGRVRRNLDASRHIDKLLDKQ